MEKSEPLNGEKSARNNGVLLAVLASVVVAYGITAFGIYELVKVIT